MYTHFVNVISCFNEIYLYFFVLIVQSTFCAAESSSNSVSGNISSTEISPNSSHTKLPPSSQSQTPRCLRLRKELGLPLRTREALDVFDERITEHSPTFDSQLRQSFVSVQDDLKNVIDTSLAYTMYLTKKICRLTRCLSVKLKGPM